MIEDEFKHTREEVLFFQRYRAQFASSEGWTIGEQFDNRFDTEVGGSHFVVTQTISDKGEIEGGFSLDRLAEYPKRTCAPRIVDYEQDGKSYSLVEAEALPELAHVLVRLKERISSHASHLASRALTTSFAQDGDQ
ncbi:hypothetical protein FGA82_30625 [Pseudomonas fluorescens]|uniref:hypothetical protein n=1 Tax=Pseudomonas fluorescens TaxID=294 RepID=UPI001131415D|nr:hypothetical protein [Pseudomonas fluorescens]TMU66457.1 hypothetical protein FGA82_30625 [Pseudomonas fluorescens]